MEDLSLHILDIVENSINARAKNVEIKVEENVENDLLTIEITDDGKGMSKEMQEKALDPFFTTRTTRNVGLGLPLFAQAARTSGGDIKIEARPGGGTKIKATFGYSNIDRQPLGDINDTLKVLIVSHPEINFIYKYKKGNENYFLDTRNGQKKGVEI
ncbi:MAG: ATP-binding protein [Candidatus Eremiobacteraeota bacterium]|nr:ATP-binding protein [Candidatus Eremiobacteraeota bacterium]